MMLAVSLPKDKDLPQSLVNQTLLTSVIRSFIHPHAKLNQLLQN